MPGNYTIMMNESDYAGNSGSWVRTFRINNNSTMNGVAITQTWSQTGQSVNITTMDAGDNDGDQYTLRCGSSTGAEDSDATPLQRPQEMKRHADSKTHGLTLPPTQYTVTSMTDIDDSAEYTDTVDSDNIPPQFTNLGINDTDSR